MYFVGIGAILPCPDPDSRHFDDPQGPLGHVRNRDHLPDLLDHRRHHAPGRAQEIAVRPVPCRPYRAPDSVAAMGFPQTRMRRLRRSARPPRDGGRNPCRREGPGSAPFRTRRHRGPAAHRLPPGRRPAHGRVAGKGSSAAVQARRARPWSCSASRRPRTPRAARPGRRMAIVQVALSSLRQELGREMVLIADLCLDEYTDHGHCGVLDAARRGRQRPDARPVRPGGPGPGRGRRRPRGPFGDDGRPGGRHSARRWTATAVRDVGILAYSAKFASALYGPFRDAVDVTIAGGGDRRGYQQDPRNPREAAARSRAGRGRGRGHGDGQTRPALPRRHRRRPPGR